MENHFVALCKIGDLDSIKTLLNKYDINIHANDELGFIYACNNTHLHVVQYLTEKYKININADRGHALCSSLNIVNYLMNLYRYNKNYSVFNLQCVEDIGLTYVDDILYCLGINDQIRRYLVSYGFIIHEIDKYYIFL